MDFKDYYKELGVDKKAELKTIKAAYRRLARKYHPDVSKETDAENKFKAIAEAYTVLKDTSKRAEYDALFEQAKSGQYRPTQGQSQGPSPGQNNANQHDFSDFFESIFKQTQNSGRREDIYRENANYDNHKGQDVEMALALSLEEAMLGGTKTISFQLPTENTPKKLKIKIPPNTQVGDLIRLKGQGLPGVNNAQAGNVYLRVSYEPHNDFDVVGSDLLLTVPISPWEAALGAKIIIPTLGSKLSLTIPPNSQTGTRLRIKNKGLKSKNKNGDLFAIFKVVMPNNNSNEINQLWKKMSDKFNFNPRPKWSQ